MAFQTHVNRYQAPGIPGTFASNNPSYSAVGGENQYVACENGVLIGRFGWTDANGRIANAGGSAPLGFILHSDMKGVMYDIRDRASMAVPAGRPVTLMQTGDFWATTGTAATVGQKVFAKLADGTLVTGNAGATVDGAIETKFYVATAGAVGETIKITTGGL